MFASISTPKDFDVDTWFTGVPSEQEMQFCLEPISTNSVLVVLSLSLFAISYLLIFANLHSNRTER